MDAPPDGSLQELSVHWYSELYFCSHPSQVPQSPYVAVSKAKYSPMVRNQYPHIEGNSQIQLRV